MYYPSGRRGRPPKGIETSKPIREDDEIEHVYTFYNHTSMEIIEKVEDLCASAIITLNQKNWSKEDILEVGKSIEILN